MQKKDRKCLKCERVFTSTNYAHRLCDKCKEKNGKVFEAERVQFQRKGGGWYAVVR